MNPVKSAVKASFLGAVAATMLPLASLHAAALASDNAGNYTGDYNNQNLGTGFGTFGLSSNPSNSSNNGTFIGDSTANAGGSGGINTSGKSFGLYSNSGYSVITRSFTAGGGNNDISLASGQTFSVALDNGYINSGNSVGLRLVNAAGTSVIAFQFTGGNADYTYNIGTGSQIDTGIGYTGNGLSIQFTEGDNNTFSLSVTPSSGTTSTFTGTATDSITQFQTFNNQAGSGGNFDFYFNSPSITGVGVPEARTWLAGFCCVGMLGITQWRRRTRPA